MHEVKASLLIITRGKSGAPDSMCSHRARCTDKLCDPRCGRPSRPPNAIAGLTTLEEF